MTAYQQAKIARKELQRLQRKAKDVIMYRKYQVIILHAKGYTRTKIAEIVGLNRKTVGTYINQYETNGVEGLTPKKPPGRPSLLTKEQEQQLYTTISQKTPEEVGFDGIKNWTAKIACFWALNEFNVKYSVNGMLDLFHRLNLSYTRPTYTLAKADPEKQRQFKENFEGIKKNC